MRRAVHCVLLALLIVGVRACGGTSAADDRLSRGSRWIAEKSGFATTRAYWQKNVGPEIERISRSATNGVQQAVTRGLENAENLRAATLDAMRNGVSSAFRRPNAAAGEVLSPDTPVTAGGPDDAAQSTAAQ